MDASTNETIQMQRFHPSSRPNKLVGLEVGESDCMSIRLEFDNHTHGDVEHAVLTLKSTMGKAADTAAKRSGYKFITETGKFFTRSGDIVVVAAVTRIG